jgi:hypothetical protein
MRFTVYCAIECLFVVMNSQVTSTQDWWTTKSHYVLEDGDELYAQCQSAAETVKLGEGENADMKPTASRTDILQTGVCWGYIKGVVDSIPAGEGFHPDANVRISQYVDIVTEYLRKNPNRRQQPAYFLARTAVTEAFPENSTRH